MESLYQSPDMGLWQGRIDSHTLFDAFRWHQWVKPLDLNDCSDKTPLIFNEKGIAFIGFCCDEGIRLNKGRHGASDGPNSIRRSLCNLPCYFNQTLKLFDAGNVICDDDASLEDSQRTLAESVYKIKALGLFPIVLGGGHELAYGHWKGLQNYLNATAVNNAKQSLGIVNFDAHFDMRPYKADADHIANGPSSGTMFRQIADDCQQAGLSFDYLCLGIQKRGNTVDLFKAAIARGTDYWLAVDMNLEGTPLQQEKLKNHIKTAGKLYVTLCTDVIASSFAPGVSAPQPLGLHPEMVTQLIKQLIRSGKVEGFDVAEVSPRFDHDSVTASLASTVIFAVVSELAEVWACATTY